jgi:hypothetical protein
MGRVAKDTTFNGGERETTEFKFMITKVPRQCPLVLLVEVGSVRIRHLEVEKVRWRVEQRGKT